MGVSLINVLTLSFIVDIEGLAAYGAISFCAYLALLGGSDLLTRAGAVAFF